MKLKKVLCAVIAGTMVMSNAVMVFANENSCDGGHTYTAHITTDEWEEKQLEH